MAPAYRLVICRPVSAAESSVPERPLLDPHPESLPPDCKSKVLVQADAVGSSPLSHPHGPSPPRARGPLPRPSLSMVCAEVFKCQTKPAPSKRQARHGWCSQSTQIGGTYGAGARWGIHRLHKENRAGSMLGILFTFWGMGFLIFRKKGSFFLPRVMWTKRGSRGLPAESPAKTIMCALPWPQDRCLPPRRGLICWLSPPPLASLPCPPHFPKIIGCSQTRVAPLLLVCQRCHQSIDVARRHIVDRKAGGGLKHLLS